MTLSILGQTLTGNFGFTQATDGAGNSVLGVTASNVQMNVQTGVSPTPNVPQIVPSYQGLPAKFDLPEGVRRSTFTRELLAPDGPRTLHVIALSSWELECSCG